MRLIKVRCGKARAVIVCFGKQRLTVSNRTFRPWLVDRGYRGWLSLR